MGGVGVDVGVGVVAPAVAVAPVVADDADVETTVAFCLEAKYCTHTLPMP